MIALIDGEMPHDVLRVLADGQVLNMNQAWDDGPCPPPVNRETFGMGGDQFLSDGRRYEEVAGREIDRPDPQCRSNETPAPLG